jgi:hypothetical protein
VVGDHEHRPEREHEADGRHDRGEKHVAVPPVADDEPDGENQQRHAEVAPVLAEAVRELVAEGLEGARREVLGGCRDDRAEQVDPIGVSQHLDRAVIAQRPGEKDVDGVGEHDGRDRDGGDERAGDVAQPVAVDRTTAGQGQDRDGAGGDDQCRR